MWPCRVNCICSGDSTRCGASGVCLPYWGFPRTPSLSIYLAKDILSLLNYSIKAIVEKSFNIIHKFSNCRLNLGNMCAWNEAFDYLKETHYSLEDLASDFVPNRLCKKNKNGGSSGVRAKYGTKSVFIHMKTHRFKSPAWDLSSADPVSRVTVPHPSAVTSCFTFSKRPSLAHPCYVFLCSLE